MNRGITRANGPRIAFVPRPEDVRAGLRSVDHRLRVVTANTVVDSLFASVHETVRTADEEGVTPQLQFPDELSEDLLDQVYRAVKKVRPSHPDVSPLDQLRGGLSAVSFELHGKLARREVQDPEITDLSDTLFDAMETMTSAEVAPVLKRIHVETGAAEAIQAARDAVSEALTAQLPDIQ